jgi:CHAT domain-containing protein
MSLLGEVHFLSGNYGEAEPLLRQALEAQQQVRGPDHPETLLTMGTLGSTYIRSSEYARAESVLSQCFELATKPGGKERAASVFCLRDLARLHLSRGDSARAEDELRRALAIGERILPPDEPSVVMTLNDLGEFYNAGKQYDRAEPLLQRALADAQRYYGPESPLLYLPLWNLGLIAQEKYNDNTRALDLYGRAVALIEKSKGPDHPDVGAILNNTANIYKSNGDYAKALELHLRVRAMFEKSLGPYHGNTVVSLGNIVRTYASMGDAENTVKFQAIADEALEKNMALNLAVGSERQKLAYFDNFIDRTERSISYQVQLAPDSQAAARLASLATLRRKGRVLDSMSANLASLRQRMDPQGQQLLDTWNTAAGQFATLSLRGPGLLSPANYRKRLADLAETRDRAEAEIGSRSAEFASQSQPVTLAAVQAAIPRDAALIEFATYRPFDPKLNGNEAYSERRYIAYVLRSDGDVRWKDLGLVREIDSAVEKFRQILGDPDRKDVGQAARSVDRRLMQPLRALAGNARQLLVAPEGSLNLLPFQALMDENGHYLVERYAISYLSSGRDLLRIEVARQHRGAPVIIADPDFGDRDTRLVAGTAPAQRRSVTIGSDLKELYFAPLAGAAQEAAAIHGLFPEARVLRGSAATESALKHVDAPSILHIATHGFFLPAAPGGVASNPLLRSGLALAGANLTTGGDDDGIFTALEASGLNLWGTRLVTLSACDTGLGEVRTGEGVFGLRRGFLLAGAETLVISLWPVSDYVTRETMTAFYTGLKNGLGRGEALRQAQLAILKRKGREHPFYWASFIESGEWASLEGKR